MRTLALCTLAILEVSACSKLPTVLSEQEREFSIESENLVQFHTVLYYPKGEALHYPGYVLALEKSPRMDIDSADIKFVHPDATYLREESNSIFAHNTRETIEEFQKRDRNSLFISHIIKYDKPAAKDVTTTLIDQCFLYNAFEASDPVDGAREWEFRKVKQMHKEKVLTAHGIAWRRCPLYPPELAPADDAQGDRIKSTRSSETAAYLSNLEILQSQYQSASPRNYIYANGLDGLKKLECGMASHMREERYSHIVIIVMGWNTSQDEAIRNFNDIIGNMVEAARNETDSPLFRPLVIGVTWPSMWTNGFINLLSYPKKAKDADEVGLVWLNIVVNQTIPQLLQQMNPDPRLAPKVVLIGHSFGARAAMRAVFSGPLLAPEYSKEKAMPAPKVDLAVALQGAVSINRFDPQRSLEGAPYRDFRKLKNTKIVLTAAHGDSATSMPFWYRPTGAAATWDDKCGGDAPAPGFECMKTVKPGNREDEGAKGNPQRDTFDLCDANKGGVCNAVLPPINGNLLYIDTSEVVTAYNSPGTGGGAHSDIYRLPMGSLLWKLTKAYAPNPLSEADYRAPIKFKPSQQMYDDCTTEAELQPKR
jgi:hypothetical protein